MNIVNENNDDDDDNDNKIFRSHGSVKLIELHGLYKYST